MEYLEYMSEKGEDDQEEEELLKDFCIRESKRSIN